MKPWVDGTRVWGYPASPAITSYFPDMDTSGTWERRGLKVQGDRPQVESVLMMWVKFLRLESLG